MSILKEKSEKKAIERCELCKKNLSVIKQNSIVELDGMKFCSQACLELWKKNNS